MKVGVVGASGYVGGELLRLLVAHPKIELSMVTSRQKAGEYVHRVHPSLKGFVDITFSPMDMEKLTDNCDLVFTSVPHGKANKIVKDLYERGMRIIDLSADFRLKNPKDYVKWYGWEHPFPELLSKSAYGVPELHRDDIIRPYKPARHRHTGEIEQELGIVAKKEIKISMSRHAVNLVRGILTTNHTFMTRAVSAVDLWKIFSNS